MEHILALTLLVIFVLAFIIYKQNNALKEYELFFSDFSLQIKDFSLFLNSILKMNILYFDDTIFELVEKVKLMKNNLVEMIKNNRILFDEINIEDIVKDEDLEHDEEQKEVLGTVKKQYGRSSTK